MKIERKGEEYGSFTVEFSKNLEEKIHKAAKELVSSVTDHPVLLETGTERIVKEYQDSIESSVSLLLNVIGLVFFRPLILGCFFSTLQSFFEPLLDHLKREACIQEEQNRQNN